MKKHPLVSYLMKITTLSLILCFVALFSLIFVPKDFLSVYIPYYILMFFFVTFLSYGFMYYAPTKMKLKFEQAFLITRFSKMLIYISVLVIVLLAHIEKNIKFAVAYMILFLVYQVFDVITVKHLSKNNKKQ